MVFAGQSLIANLITRRAIPTVTTFPVAGVFFTILEVFALDVASVVFGARYLLFLGTALAIFYYHLKFYVDTSTQVERNQFFSYLEA